MRFRKHSDFDNLVEALLHRKIERARKRRHDGRQPGSVQKSRARTLIQRLSVTQSLFFLYTSTYTSIYIPLNNSLTDLSLGLRSVNCGNMLCTRVDNHAKEDSYEGEGKNFVPFSSQESYLEKRTLSSDTKAHEHQQQIEQNRVKTFNCSISKLSLDIFMDLKHKRQPINLVSRLVPQREKQT
uniref:Uncharacterized protein n=1 Tax=Glossina palpalis gambiensis TaxID=67801 RepID=A0A1B0C4B8_9MUSC